VTIQYNTIQCKKTRRNSKKQDKRLLHSNKLLDGIDPSDSPAEHLPNPVTPLFAALGLESGEQLYRRRCFNKIMV
jgi:hypothetical protein